MNSRPPQTQSKFRKFARSKLSNHSKIRKFAIPLYSKFSDSTGFLHSLPDFLIIGSMKCGTTSLYEYLVRHPEIKAAAGKEIDYFDLQFSRGINWYRSYFPLNIEKQISKNFFHKKLLTGEATPGYIDYPHAANRIQEIIPNVKLIILLRNPIDRAYSHYNMNSTLEHDSISFDKAVEIESERIKGEMEKMQNNPSYFSWEYYWHGYLNHGIYIDKIKHWMSVFPKEQFLIIQTEEFQKDTSKVYNEVLEFLGLPKWELKEYAQFKKRKYKSPKMNPETRDKLIEYFKPHNRRLYDFLGREFDWDK